MNSISKRNKQWYRFTDECIAFIDNLITDIFGTKMALAKGLKECLNAGGIKSSVACCMYDISYMGTTGDRLAVYRIAFKSMGYTGEVV